MKFVTCIFDLARIVQLLCHQIHFLPILPAGLLLLWTSQSVVFYLWCVFSYITTNCLSCIWSLVGPKCRKLLFFDFFQSHLNVLVLLYIIEVLWLNFRSTIYFMSKNKERKNQRYCFSHKDPAKGRKSKKQLSYLVFCITRDLFPALIISFITTLQTPDSGCELLKVFSAKLLPIFCHAYYCF